MFAEVMIFLIHLLFGLPVIWWLSFFAAFFAVDLILLLDDKYQMNLFKTATKNQKYLEKVKNAKKQLRKISDKKWDAELLMKKAKEKMAAAEKQHQENLDEWKALDICWDNLDDNAALFEHMQNTVSLELQKEVISRTCDVISKMTTNSSFAKKLKPYIVSAEVLNNYAIDNQVRGLLAEEFDNDVNKQFVLQTYDNAMSYHYSPVIAAWALYELLHHTT